MIALELNRILQQYLPMVETLQKEDVFLLETIRQICFATNFGYLTQLMESMEVTAQAQQDMMERRYEQMFVPEEEDDI